MHWVWLILLGYLVLLFQTTLGRLFNFDISYLGGIGPDFMAMVTVFVALYAREAADAMLTGCILGLGVDLAAGGAVGAMASVGPMPVAYAIAAALIFRIREGMFRDRALTRVLLTIVFCALSHGLWVTLQGLLTASSLTWRLYGRMLLEVLVVAIYTGLLAPLVLYGLSKIQRWLFAVPPGRSRRTAR